MRPLIGCMRGTLNRSKEKEANGLDLYLYFVGHFCRRSRLGHIHCKFTNYPVLMKAADGCHTTKWPLSGKKLGLMTRMSNNRLLRHDPKSVNVEKFFLFVLLWGFCSVFFVCLLFFVLFFCFISFYFVFFFWGGGEGGRGCRTTIHTSQRRNSSRSVLRLRSLIDVDNKGVGEVFSLTSEETCQPILVVQTSSLVSG